MSAALFNARCPGVCLFFGCGSPSVSRRGDGWPGRFLRHPGRSPYECLPVIHPGRGAVPWSSGPVPRLRSVAWCGGLTFPTDVLSASGPPSAWSPVTLLPGAPTPLGQRFRLRISWWWRLGRRRGAGVGLRGPAPVHPPGRGVDPGPCGHSDRRVERIRRTGRVLSVKWRATAARDHPGVRGVLFPRSSVSPGRATADNARLSLCLSLPASFPSFPARWGFRDSVYLDG